MKVVILYKPRSEFARQVETYVRDYQDRHESTKLELLDYDSREGNAVATLYDIMEVPAILALATDGSLLQAWTGPNFPLMDEIAYYTFA
jgi:hypothetical protein